MIRIAASVIMASAHWRPLRTRHRRVAPRPRCWGDDSGGARRNLTLFTSHARSCCQSPLRCCCPSFSSPLIRALAKLHVPAPAGAALLVLSFVAAVAVASDELAAPVEEWVTHAPEAMHRAGSRAPRSCETGRSSDKGGRGSRASHRRCLADSDSRGHREGAHMAHRVFGTSQAVVETGLEVVALLDSLLASGDMFLESWSRCCRASEISERRSASRAP